MSVGRSVARQILFGGLTQLLVSLRGLIIMPIIVKTAGESVFGSYVLLSSIVVFAGGISAFGTDYTYRRSLPATDSGRQRRDLMMPALAFRLASVSVLALLLYAGGPALFGLMGESMPFSPAYLALWLFGLMVHDYATTYYRYTTRFGIYNLLTIGQIYVHIGAAVALVFWGQALDLDMLLLLQGGSLLALSLPTLVLGVFRETGLCLPRFDWPQFRADARLGLPLTGEFIVDFLVSFGDRYLIGLFLSMAAVGQYQSSYALAGLLAFFPKVLATVLPPPLCRLWDEGQRHEAEELVSQSLRLFLVLAIPFVVGALMAGPSVVALLTTPTMALAGRWAVALISAGMLFYGIVILLSGVAFVTRQTSVILTANVIAVIGNLGLNAALLPFYPDVTVPAAVSVVAYGLSFSYALYKVRPHLRITFRWPSLLRSLLAAGVMGGGLFALGYAPGSLGPTQVGQVALHIGAAIVLYFGVFLLIGGLSAADRQALIGLIRQKSRSA